MNKEQIHSTTETSPNRKIRTSAEVRRNRIIAAVSIGIVTLGIMKLADNHNREKMYAQIQQTRVEQEAIAEARRDAIDKLALADPAATSLSVIAEFKVPEGSNISDEAFTEINKFTERRKANGEEIPNSLVNQRTGALLETITESGNAHEANGFTQPNELFIVSEVDLSYGDTEEIVYVVQTP